MLINIFRLSFIRCVMPGNN